MKPLRRQNVDQFVIQRGRSARKSVSMERLKEVNSLISEINLEGASHQFTGIPGAKSMPGSRMTGMTVSAVVTSDALEKAGLTSFDESPAYNIRLGKSQKKFLKKQGIKVGKHTQNVSFISPQIIEDSISSLRTPIHELGHAFSFASGAKGMDGGSAATDFFNFVTKANQGRVTRGQAMMGHQMFLNSMMRHGLEEGRAELFSIENISQRLQSLGDQASEPLRSFKGQYIERLRSGGISYGQPRSFSKYANRYSGPLRDLLGSLPEEELGRMKGPMSEKVGLTLDELVEEMVLEGKVRASSATIGTLQTSTGEVGQAVRAGIAKNIQLADERAPEIFGQSVASKISDIRTNVIADIASEGRGLSIVRNSMNEGVRRAGAKVSGKRAAVVSKGTLAKIIESGQTAAKVMRGIA
jgi:hypothetical protein